MCHTGKWTLSYINISLQISWFRQTWLPVLACDFMLVFRYVTTRRIATVTPHTYLQIAKLHRTNGLVGASIVAINNGLSRSLVSLPNNRRTELKHWGTGEVKFLPHKHENCSFGPRTHIKMLGVLAQTWNSATWEERQEPI